jgi:hypothetical protein
MNKIEINMSEFRRMVAAEQLLDNLREYLGNLLLDQEHPLIGKEDIQMLVDMTALPVRAAVDDFGRYEKYGA